jgi:hypothetical protein
MKKRRLYIGGAVAAFVIGGILMIAFGRRGLQWLRNHLAQPLPVSSEVIESDGSYTNVIFLHHSTGRNLIAEGNVRELFSQLGYEFWDHDYNTIGLTRPDGSITRTSYDIPELVDGERGGGNTDPDGLVVLFSQTVHSPPDNAFSRLLQHEVIIVKSCFPNSGIDSDAELEQNKNWYLQMRDIVDQHADRIFIILTSPPLHPLSTDASEATRARVLADWLGSEEYLQDRKNLFVFDLFDQLTDSETNMLREEYQRDTGSSDSHPNITANRQIGPIFVEFVDQAIITYKSSR